MYDKLDMVLQMTVNPGFGGQSYIPAMTEKIRELRKRLDEAGYQKVDIEVDGGVNQKTLDAVLEAGASIIVAGSAVFKGDISANIARFREKIGTYAQGKGGLILLRAAIFSGGTLDEPFVKSYLKEYKPDLYPGRGPGPGVLPQKPDPAGYHSGGF